MNNVKLQLKSMGYRQLVADKATHWGKPVGNVLLTVELRRDDALWTNWFKQVGGKTVAWERQQIPYTASFVRILKQHETFTRYDLTCDEVANFEFHSIVEEMDL